jgi:glycosyltransferase involved in cell wall biosynthesis
VLSIVMPAHNEIALLGPSIRAVAGGLRAWRRPFELLAVENGSRDGTPALATRLAGEFPELRVYTFPNADYGAALRTGILAATGDIVVTFDVDYYDLGFLEQALTLLECGSGQRRPDVVIASKRAAGARDTRPWLRRLMTAVFATMLRVGFGLQVSDTHGMKALRREAVEPLARRCRFRRDLFDTELILRTERAGLVTVELPVTVEERRPSRTPLWRRVPRTLIGLVHLRVALWREPRQ